MGARRLAVLVLTTLAAVLSAEPAQAVVCGDKSARTGKRAVGALTLRVNESRPTYAFGRETATERLALLFSVTGCTLPRRAKVRLAFLPVKGADHWLRRRFAARHITTTRSSPHNLDVIIPVLPKTFKPGSYGTLVQVTARYLAISRTPVGVTRSEHRVAIPVLIGATGALIGLGLSLLTKAAGGSEVRTRGWRLPVVALVAIGAGAIAGFAVYDDQEIWRMSENWLLTGAAGLTSATTGTVLALLGLVVAERTTSPADR